MLLIDIVRQSRVGRLAKKKKAKKKKAKKKMLAIFKRLKTRNFKSVFFNPRRHDGGGGGAILNIPSRFFALNFCSLADYQKLWHMQRQIWPPIGCIFSRHRTNNRIVN